MLIVWLFLLIITWSQELNLRKKRCLCTNMVEKYVRYKHHVELIRDLTHMLSSFVNLVMRIK